MPRDRAGVRLRDLLSLAELLEASSPIGSIANAIVGPGCRAVRAILFDKSPQANWALGWHQDRTIAVAKRIDAPGFGNWSRKDGIVHVEPPFALLERMVTLRVHLDAVNASNGPLLVVPGSHRLGRVRESEVQSVVDRCGTRACRAEAGDVWAYSTPILHASEAAIRPLRRRVLQVDYSADVLRFGLAWAGV